MELHPTQDLVAQDNTQYRIVDCGRQWGKTTLAVYEMLACAYAGKDRKVTYFATTFGQARDIAWSMLKNVTRSLWAKSPNESRLELYLKTQDGGVSEIFLKGFEAVETSRGTQNDLLVLDEVSKMRNFKEGWQGALLGTLAFRKGKALFISTPYGFNHFHELYELGQGQDPLYKSWRFSSYENPYLSKDYLANVKQTVTPDFWAQEYLADFTRFTGLVYPEFDLTRHIYSVDHEFNEHADYYFGLDFAVRGYTAMIAGYMKPDGHFYIPAQAEYKEINRTAQQHQEPMREILEKIANFDKFTGYSDPAGWAKNQQGIRNGKEMVWSIADEYLESDFPLVMGNNEVNAGINYIRQLLKNEKIHIDPTNTKLIEEFMQYQWKDQTDKKRGVENEPEQVRKVNDHLVDSLRYMLYSKPQAAEEQEQKRTTVFPAVFPLKLEKPPEDEDKFTPIEIDDIYSS